MLSICVMSLQETKLQNQDLHLSRTPDLGKRLTLSHTHFHLCWEFKLASRHTPHFRAVCPHKAAGYVSVQTS